MNGQGVEVCSIKCESKIPSASFHTQNFTTIKYFLVYSVNSPVNFGKGKIIMTVAINKKEQPLTRA